MTSAGYVPPHFCQHCEQFLPRLYAHGNFYHLPKELRDATAKAIWGPEADSDTLTARQKETTRRHHFFQTSRGALTQCATSGCLLADCLAKDLRYVNEKRVVTLSIHWSDYNKKRPYDTILFGYVRSTTPKDSFHIHLQSLYLSMFDVLKIRGMWLPFSTVLWLTMTHLLTNSQAIQRRSISVHMPSTRNRGLNLRSGLIATGC
jgi:hypothetical protein